MLLTEFTPPIGLHYTTANPRGTFTSQYVCISDSFICPCGETGLQRHHQALEKETAQNMTKNKKTQ